MSRLLFLRPFWDVDATATQLRTICRTTAGLGHVIAIRNGSERSQLRVVGDSNAWSGYGALAARLFDWANPPLDLTLVEANDNNWQQHALEQIRSADAVIVSLAPSAGPNVEALGDFRVNTTLQQHFDVSQNPVQEIGAGQGLLRELAYCREAKALKKVVVLIPVDFYPRVARALRLVHVQSHGTTFRNVDDRRIFGIPRLSALDRSLSVLRDVHALFVYPKFGGIAFKRGLRKLVSRCLLESRQETEEHRTSSVQPITGIPSIPVRLPPDDELKHIRFTPIERLTIVPAREIVELSFEEVRHIHPDIDDEPYTCPGCGQAPDCIFWFQYGLEPKVALGEYIFQRCQYCGHDDYILPRDHLV